MLFGCCCYFLFLRLFQKKAEKRWSGDQPPSSLCTLCFQWPMAAMWSYLAERLQAAARSSVLLGPGFSVLPWLGMAVLPSGLVKCGSRCSQELKKTPTKTTKRHIFTGFWGACLVESRLRKTEKYFELIYFAVEMLWKKQLNHLFATCCGNVDLLSITYAKIAQLWASIAWGNLFFFTVQQCYEFAQLCTFIWDSFLCNYLCEHP